MLGRSGVRSFAASILGGGRPLLKTTLVSKTSDTVEVFKAVSVAGHRSCVQEADEGGRQARILDGVVVFDRPRLSSRAVVNAVLVALNGYIRRLDIRLRRSIGWALDAVRPPIPSATSTHT